MRNEINNGQDTFDSLEDAINNYFELDDYDSYEEYIESMPNTRESVNELLKSCSSYDLLEIYNKLLTDCKNILSKEEKDKLETDYKRIFSVPLPGEIE